MHFIGANPGLLCLSRTLDLGASASVAKFAVSLAQRVVHDAEADVPDLVFVRSTTGANIWQCQAAILPKILRTVLSRVWTRWLCWQRPAREPERALPGEQTKVPKIPADDDRGIIQIYSNYQMVLDGGSPQKKLVNKSACFQQT